ncbi:unnamed protein product [Adineta steineri]|uniref:Uncharacterized protein n=1 Tax=Adineta steineri TaxID=433720 RepID=A0A814HAH7_9BILA|nr:unnamed protein product [Adineta steineri]
MNRNTILNKLSQLEAIKNKHLTRTIELKRQTQQSTSATAIAVNNIEQKDLLNSLFSSSSPKSIGLMSMDSNNSTAISSPISSLYNNSSQSSSPTTPSLYTSSYQHQRNSSPGYRPYESGQSSTPFHDSHTRVKTPVFDEFLTSPPSSVSYVPVNNHSLSVHSYMNVSFQEATNNSSTITPSSFNYHHQHHHNTTYPY